MIRQLAIIATAVTTLSAFGADSNQKTIDALQQQIQTVSTDLHQALQAQQASTQKAIEALQAQVQAQITTMQTQMQKMQDELNNRIKQVQAQATGSAAAGK